MDKVKSTEFFPSAFSVAFHQLCILEVRTSGEGEHHEQKRISNGGCHPNGDNDPLQSVECSVEYCQTGNSGYECVDGCDDFAFIANPYPEPIEAIRTSVVSNSDDVVVRKAETRSELQAKTDALMVELELMISTNTPVAQISQQEKRIGGRQTFVDETTDLCG